MHTYRVPHREVADVDQGRVEVLGSKFEHALLGGAGMRARTLASSNPALIRWFTTSASSRAIWCCASVDESVPARKTRRSPAARDLLGRRGPRVGRGRAVGRGEIHTERCGIHARPERDRRRAGRCRAAGPVVGGCHDPCPVLVRSRHVLAGRAPTGRSAAGTAARLRRGLRGACRSRADTRCRVTPRTTAISSIVMPSSYRALGLSLPESAAGVREHLERVGDQAR